MVKQKYSSCGIAQTKEEEIPCRICKESTRMLGTKLCDGCWELETRIHCDPEIAVKILNRLKVDVKFNINDLVSVQLTKFGHRQLRAQHELLREQYKKPKTDPDWAYTLPNEDADGWSVWNLWSIMSRLGQYCFMAGELPIKTNILLKGVKYHAKTSRQNQRPGDHQDPQT